jgi:hypothetical protein
MKKQTKNQQRAKGAEVNKEEFPGYPQYPATEDMMNRGQRIDLDLDSAGENTGNGVERSQGKDVANKGNNKRTSDLTKDDLQALPSDEVQSTGDDEILQSRPWPVDFAGDDLDIPGSEQDDAQELLGSEDEENNSYSLGSDRHADLEEDPT